MPQPNLFNRIVNVICAAVCAAAIQPAMASADTALTERGRYVAIAADCGSCHSQRGQNFAGGAALDTPFGKIYPPNITQDPSTGIGGWTLADFDRAVRQGIGKDGALLYPAMPYTNYTKISDDDLNALWAYIRSLPAIKHESPKNTLPFPLNIRSSLIVWQELYFKPGRFRPDAAHDAVWNRGAYLVDALGHCDMCHTQRNLAQATEPRHYLTGAQIEGWYAPDISDDPLSDIARWNTDELARFLKSGNLPGNVKSFGPMNELIHDSLHALTDADLHAIAVYLKAQPGGVTPTTAHRSTISPEQAALGKSVYEDNCASCHQSDGSGQKANIPALAGNKALASQQPNDVIMAVLYGFPPQGTWGPMASFAKTLNDDQIAAVANYVRTAWGNGGEPNALAWSVGNWREQMTPAEQNPNAALICPNLAPDVLRPALRADPHALLQAATDQGKLNSVVSGYTKARPGSSTAEVIEALSTAYCRAVVKSPASRVTNEARIAEFSQRVAITLAKNTAKASP